MDVRAARSSFLCSQWKVRHIVASSIHELAVILGEDLATEDLVPVFSGFMKDLDEVRIGVLKHLADFLKVFSCPRGMLLCNCVTSPFPFLVRYWPHIRLYAVVLLWGPFVSCAYLHSCQKFRFIVYFLLPSWMDPDRPGSSFWGTAASNNAICEVSEQYQESQSVSLLTAIFDEGLALLEIDLIMYENHNIDIHAYCCES